MVQRKVPSKLCIQKTDHLKSENRNGKLRPPSPRFQDGKNKGAEMKKKMKRSKSMNPSSIESFLKTPNFIKQVPQPGKPPPDGKQKQVPNYMKSTSSFEARKEQFQVNLQASVKSPKKDLKNLKPSSNSVDKVAKTLTRTHSLKRVKSLTKTPSFKPTRSANKKCSQVVLCKDSNSQRATCSSTLKDTKFPSYLKLSRGATESAGTSLMKVCPYTYCSLNGHMHAPLPPLKCFLSAKRHKMKTQKSIKLACLSPRKTKPSCDLAAENIGKMVVDEKATTQEPRVQEDHTDFFIEIYVENKGDGAVDGLSNEKPNSETDFNCCEVMKTDADAEQVSSVKSDQEEETPEIVSNQTEIIGSDSETCDMEWEEGQHFPGDKDGYFSESSSSTSENDPDFHNGKNFDISCFEEIWMYKGEEVLVQYGEDETEFINNNGDENLIEPVEDKEPRALLANEPQQDEIQGDYECIGNNTNIFELDVCHDGVLIGDLLADTENTATNESLEQKMEEREQTNSNESLIGLWMTHGESNEVSDDDCIYAETCIPPLDNEFKSKSFVADQINTSQAQIYKSLDSFDSDQAHSQLDKVIIADDIIPDTDLTERDYSDHSDDKDSFIAETNETHKPAKTAYTRGRGRSPVDLQSNSFNLQITKREKSDEDLEKEREFNPREPNYLPVTPDVEAEKVDLRHQDLDDRKNAEEWMIDYALQQAVTRLAPARRRKVALLVEAFEKVTPPTYEPRLRRSSSAFDPGRHIQACS